jgi:hypothetical protein
LKRSEEVRNEEMGIMHPICVFSICEYLREMDFFLSRRSTQILFSLIYADFIPMLPHESLRVAKTNSEIRNGNIITRPLILKGQSDLEHIDKSANYRFDKLSIYFNLPYLSFDQTFQAKCDDKGRILK